ncbi:hypothetical protein [Acerihabitans sp.]
MKNSHYIHRAKAYRETLNDAQFAIAVLAVAAGALISFMMAVTLWII